MPAYARYLLAQFSGASPDAVLGQLQRAYAADGFASQYTRQTEAWATSIPLLQHACRGLIDDHPESRSWSILLELPLHRLRRRIDVVVLAGSTVIVVEIKVGTTSFLAVDRRQVEEYALDLRDFHGGSAHACIVPLLWSTAADPGPLPGPDSHGRPGEVARLVQVGREGLLPFLSGLTTLPREPALNAEAWDAAPYRPVPSIIEAATRIFAGHEVRAIANADADNLAHASARLLELLADAKARNRCYLVLLAGVPGSGKTLVGLDVVHSSQTRNAQQAGDVVYLSGNTPLVVVLREALAQDEHARSLAEGLRSSLDAQRRAVRARIQHVNDFLQEGVRGVAPPHEHVIVFDEAQRAWDEKQGQEKFQRAASEPTLLLDLMSRHSDWCACVCLIGSGQEINAGEKGAAGWGDALRAMSPDVRARWDVFAPPSLHEALGSTPSDLFASPERAPEAEPHLQLSVPQRSFRAPALSAWVDAVLEGDAATARDHASALERYPLVLTRSIGDAKAWLRTQGRGERRYGLLASAQARRLRAEGLGVLLAATDGQSIAHWYLNPPGDLRSSYALEVPANEYASQGLEIDFAGVCWDGDLLWDPVLRGWRPSKLSGPRWQQIKGLDTRRHRFNAYRVLLTRAREGMVLYVPQGDATDSTRAPAPFDATADFLSRCGAAWLGAARPP